MFAFHMLIQMIEFCRRKRTFLTRKNTFWYDFVTLRNSAMRWRHTGHIRMLEHAHTDQSLFTRFDHQLSHLPVWEYLTRTDDFHDRSVEYLAYGWRLNDVSNVPSDRICYYISDIHSCVDLDGRAYGAEERDTSDIQFLAEKCSSYLQFGETFTVVRTQVTLKLIGLTWMTVDMILKVLINGIDQLACREWRSPTE